MICIKNMMRYLISRTEDYTYKAMSVIKFHIPVTQQLRDDEKVDFPNGNINFDLSHGLAGPLLALTKAFNKKIYAEGLEEAINKFFSIYDTFQITEQCIVRWPTQLCVFDFHNKNFCKRDSIDIRGLIEFVNALVLIVILIFSIKLILKLLLLNYIRKQLK